MTAVPPLPESILLGIVQGMTYSLTVTWTDGADPDPNPISMAGRYAHMSIRTKANASGLPIIDSYSGHITAGADADTPEDLRLVTSTVADIIQEPSGQTGKIVIRLPATATAALRKTTYSFDLYTISATDPTDAVQLATGTVTVENSTTVTLLEEPA